MRSSGCHSGLWGTKGQSRIGIWASQRWGSGNCFPKLTLKKSRGNVLSPGPTALHLLLWGLWPHFGGEALGQREMLTWEAICHQEQMTAAGPCHLWVVDPKWSVILAPSTPRVLIISCERGWSEAQRLSTETGWPAWAAWPAEWVPMDPWALCRGAGFSLLQRLGHSLTVIWLFHKQRTECSTAKILTRESAAKPILHLICTLFAG